MQFTRFLLPIVAMILFSSCSSKLTGTVVSERSAGAEQCSDATFVAKNPEICATDSAEEPFAETAAKLRIDGCVDPDLDKLLNTESITLCNGTEANGKLSISADDVRSGATIAGVEGSFSGSYSNCTIEGEQGCITSGLFKAIDPATLPGDCGSDGDQSCVVTGSFAAATTTGLADKLLSTESAAGVTGNVMLPLAAEVESGVAFGVNGAALTGTKPRMKQCRNAADLSAWDTSGISNIGINSPTMTANTTNVDLDLDELNWNPVIYDLTDDFPLQVTTTDTLPSPLLTLTTYYVIISGTKIKLALSAGGAAIDITTTGTGSIRLSPDPDASVGLWDTIDDYNNNQPTAPNETPGWDLSYVCDENNFADVSASGDLDLTPSNATPAGATAAFSQIWRDDLTGLHFTNILYDGSGSVRWAGGMAMCAGIDSGDGPGNWRMPTQKELMQLYVDGISKVTVAGGAWTALYMWSSSAVSDVTSNAWVANLAYGYSNSNYRLNTYHGVFCVR